MGWAPTGTGGESVLVTACAGTTAVMPGRPAAARAGASAALPDDAFRPVISSAVTLAKYMSWTLIDTPSCTPDSQADGSEEKGPAGATEVSVMLGEPATPDAASTLTSADDTEASFWLEKLAARAG